MRQFQILLNRYTKWVWLVLSVLFSIYPGDSDRVWQCFTLFYLHLIYDELTRQNDNKAAPTVTEVQK